MTTAVPRLDISLRVSGALDALSDPDREALLRRAQSFDGVRDITASIIADVRARGDAALRELARRFDGAQLEELEVPRSTVRRALETTPTPVRSALERAAANIAAAHRAFAPASTEVEVEPGIVVGRRADPLGRVGVYAPGGRAAYPSSVLMAAIPARVAGVGEVILASPPDAAGSPAAVILAAVEIAGVDRVFAVGGAGAIAAMAFGTASIPRVDRIVGPGNAYVAAAKLQLVGEVSIDAPAGPSELLVLADGSADPEAIAVEMIAQAEHDPHACVVAVVTSEAIAEAVRLALASGAGATPRAEVVRAALAAQGAVLTARGLAEGIAFANAFAPEHLLLAVADPEAVLPSVRNAGTICVGAPSSVAFGDYMTGANHVLPTGGSARSYSGLSTSDFVRWTTYQRVSRSAAASLSRDVATLAIAEGLPAHAAAAARWEAFP